MKRASVLVLLGLLGCIRETPRNTPQVQPEPAAQTVVQRPSTEAVHAEAAPAPTPAAPVEAAPAAPAAAANEPAARRLGQPITESRTTALAAIARDPSRYSGHTVRTEGTVTAVCQQAGCWMQLSDADQRVHVRMHGHSFFVPRNASGRHARVQGTVVSGNPNGHCEQEAAEATGQQAAARLELDATGVELL